MPEPIVFISHFRIKEGSRDAYEELARDVTPKLEAEKPSTLVFLTYENEPGDRLSIVHAFADADGMDRHFQGRLSGEPPPCSSSNPQAGTSMGNRVRQYLNRWVSLPHAPMSL